MQEDSITKREVKKWNWGAFLLTFIWGIGNRVYISLLALIPIVNIVMAVILGVKGNEWAWRKNRSLSLAEFKQLQKSWAKWGIIIIAITSVVFLVLIKLFVLRLENEDRMKIRDNTKIANTRQIVSAINHYKYDNQQECPSSLDALVPKYLSKIPESDTFSESKYLFKTEEKRCVVSVELEDKDNSFLKSDSNPGNGRIYDLEAEDISNLIFYQE